MPMRNASLRASDWRTTPHSSLPRSSLGTKSGYARLCKLHSATTLRLVRRKAVGRQLLRGQRHVAMSCKL